MPEREGAVAGGAERPAEPGIRAVGDDHVAGPHRLDLARVLVAHHRAGEQAAVDDRGDRLRALPDRGAGLDRLLGDHLVELAAADDVPVRREVRVLGPRELERDAVRDRPQTVEALEADEPIGETHVVQLADGARREPVAAGLLARKVLLLDREDRMTTRREPIGGRRARRSRAHDQHVEIGSRESPESSARARSRAHDHMLGGSETKRELATRRLPHNVPDPPLAW